MKIDSNKNRISFSAIPLSKIHIKTPKIKQSYKLYDLTREDHKYLENLYDKINLEELCPKLQIPQYFMWDSIIHDALICKPDNIHKAYLIATENKQPCGIINFKELPRKYFISLVSTWPISKNCKPPFACKAMMNEIFHKFINDDAKSIELYALRGSVGSPISKYLDMGFGIYGGDDITETMRIRRSKVAEMLEKFKQFMTREPLTKQENIDLSKELIF